jgi:uncharacterized protein (TIGR02145 family)
MPNPKPSIPSVSTTTAAPAALTTANTWGFAVENRLGFDTTYTIDNASNKYAGLITTDTPIYQTTQMPSAADEFKFFYGVLVNTARPAGSYAATITYTAVGEVVPEPPNFLANIKYYNNLINMQDLTPSLCTSADYDSDNNGINNNNTIELMDSRNSQTYTVRKMADNKCWMLDNLKLELIHGMTLTTQNTDVTANTTVYFTQDGTQNGTLLDGMTGNFTTSGQDTRNNGASTSGSNQDAWRQNNPSNAVGCVDNSSNIAAANNKTYADGSLTGCGYFYNYYTATAGTYPQSAYNASNRNAPGSICPAGWRLPSGYDTSSDFATLDADYGGTGAYQSGTPAQLSTLWFPGGAFRGTFSGRYLLSVASSGINGNFWSSSVSNDLSAYGLFIDSSATDPGTNIYYRYYGLAVRCVTGP